MRSRGHPGRLAAALLGLFAAGLLPVPAAAQPAPPGAPPGPVAPVPPALQIQFGTGGPPAWGAALNIVLLLTVLTLLPALLMSLTCFTRILISLHFLRQALGTQTAPANQVLVGLALFLTYYVMAPVGTRIHEDAITPLLAGSIDGPAAVERAWPPLREFMLRNTRTSELSLFESLSGTTPAASAPVEARILIPAFLVSEIKTAFQIGILLYLPFLVVELVVSSVLLSLGMLQLPPIVISTPIKLVLFVVVDGWDLVIGSIVRSIR